MGKGVSGREGRAHRPKVATRRTRATREDRRSVCRHTLQAVDAGGGGDATFTSDSSSAARLRAPSSGGGDDEPVVVTTASDAGAAGADSDDAGTWWAPSRAAAGAIPGTAAPPGGAASTLPAGGGADETADGDAGVPTGADDVVGRCRSSAAYNSPTASAGVTAAGATLRWSDEGRGAGGADGRASDEAKRFFLWVCF